MVPRLVSALAHAVVFASGLAACDAGKSSKGSGDDDGGTGGVTAGTGGQPAGAAGQGGGQGSSALQGQCDPTGSTAMVSLTYDDALGSQLKNAVPALETHKLKATFFLTNVYVTTGWAEVKQKGHELGAHTLLHPCPKADWVTPGNSSQEYDLARLETELDDNIAQLETMGQTAPFTFAYPCGVDWVGDPQESYVDLVKERFTAARGVVPGVITALSDEYHVPASFLTGTGASLIALVDQAKAKNGWVVFGFHGVGGDHSMVQTADHEALLAYLEEQGAAVRVLPFGPAVECMKAR